MRETAQNSTASHLEDGLLLDAVFAPGTANHIAESDSRLKKARQIVRAARQAGIGIYDPLRPLQLQAFDTRFLSH